MDTILEPTSLAAFQATDCEVRADAVTRQLYATDASIHRVAPRAVAFPRNAEQARAVILAAGDAGLSVTPRGAGTGLVGGALGDGLIIDFARHNRAIGRLDLEKRTVHVGAGVVLDSLNAFLKPYGYCFGPDVATSSRATIGGMIANNSSGSHVPIYGTTADHVRHLEIVLADGRIETIGREQTGLLKERRDLTALIQQHGPLITQRLPRDLLKRWPGYGIDRLFNEPDNFSHLLAGSEGTLAAIMSAELQIVPLPRTRGVGLIFFASIAEAMQATVELLDLKPAAIEHIDRVLCDQTRGQLAFQAARDLLQLDAKPCESILIVEFFDDAVPERLAALDAKRLGQRTHLLQTGAEAALLWNMRKAGVALLTGCRGDAKPVTGIEDAAVRPEQLPEYVAALQGLLRPLQLEACFYGHAASGLLHVRPVLDLHAAADLKKFRQIMQDVSALVRQFKGSLTGEHGVGIARTEFIRDQLGDELHAVMQQVKDTFDPGRLFNPGKILGDGRYRCDADMRLGAEPSHELPFTPVLAYAAKDESFVRHLEQCNGCGGCRKETPTMCPTFLATGEEIMSTRGRANVIRAVLDAQRRAAVKQCVHPDADGGPSAPSELELSWVEGASPDGRAAFDPGALLESAALADVLEHCLGCKACAAECPSNVNLALLKAELLHAKYQRCGLPLRTRLVASVDALGRLGCLAPELANAALGWPWLRRLLRQHLDLTDRRPLPPYAQERFDAWFAGRLAARKTFAPRGRVWLWDDTFVRYHEPHIGQAAVRVLEAAGFEVALVQQRRCCGRPAFSQGDLDRAARHGLHNLTVLSAGPGHEPILFLEPSCYSMFVEDYRELKLPGAAAIAQRCHLFESFIDQLLEREPSALEFVEQPERLLIHGHCHAKALVEVSFLARLGRRLPGRTATLLETGCCGMAGAFGALESKYDLSVRIAAPLVALLNAQPPHVTVVASGTSCRHQIEHLTPRRPRHMAEVLAEALLEERAKGG